MLRLFEGQNHAELYAKYRPTYPVSVAKIVIDFANGGKPDCKLSHMVDVGCGNGQATDMYCDYFERITAIDISESQIEEANKKPSGNVTYRVATAEKIPVEDKSVDLICSAQAIHWADFSQFLEESRRVLKYDGSIALYGYKRPHILPVGRTGEDGSLMKQNARELLLNFHEKCLFHPNIRHVDNGYKEIYELIPGDKRRDDNLKIERNWDLGRLGLYLKTWSGYQEYLKRKNKEEKDILEQFLDGLRTLWGVGTQKNEDIQVNVTWDIFIILFKRP